MKETLDYIATTCYIEDGALHTFNPVIGIPPSPSTVAIRNIGQLELPLNAVVRPDMNDGLAVSIASIATRLETIQGGSIQTYSFNPPSTHWSSSSRLTAVL
jgi:hypothetical protein